jgi:hypothetical protein
MVENEVQYHLRKPEVSKFKNELLDPNHSHFVLVDDAKHDFRGEVRFRAELERKLIEKDKIPIVVLVIGGGPGTAEFVYEAVKKSTPCVFLDTSGELANVFSHAVKMIQDGRRARNKQEQRKRGGLERQASVLSDHRDQAKE